MSSMNFTYDVCGREVLSCTFVNGMNFTCDVCGREVFTCIFVNGMKFCAKCYQETFGETDKDRKIADLEAKLAECEKKAYSRGHSQRDIANEIKLNALREDVANKEKRIVELKKQLAESENQCRECKHLNKKIELNIKNKLMAENCELQKQLAEKENTLSIKSVIKTLIKHNNLNCSFRDKTKAQIQQCGDVYNSNYGYFNFEEDYDESLNNKKDSRFDIISIDLAQNKSRSQ